VAVELKKEPWNIEPASPPHGNANTCHDVPLNRGCRPCASRTPGNAELRLGTRGDAGTMGMTDLERRLLKGGGSKERILVRVPEACHISGFSRSELYRRAGRREIIFLKCGSSTLVDLESLRAAVASLPRAAIKGA